MNAWDKLEDKIESAKSKAKKTDAILEKELLSRCSNCGGRLRPVGIDKLVCEKCGAEKATAKSVLKKALEENPGVTAMELAEITGIPRSEIYAYLDDGFLELARKSVGTLRCEICGATLLNGTVCSACKQAYKPGFGDVNVREGRSTGHVSGARSGSAGKSDTKVHYMGRRK